MMSKVPVGGAFLPIAGTNFRGPSRARNTKSFRMLNYSQLEYEGRQSSFSFAKSRKRFLAFLNGEISNIPLTLLRLVLMLETPYLLSTALALPVSPLFDNVKFLDFFQFYAAQGKYSETICREIKEGAESMEDRGIYSLDFSLPNLPCLDCSGRSSLQL